MIMILPLENTAMCWAVTGPLGSGKSLVAVATAVDCLSDRHTVVCTNVHLDLKQVSRYCGFDVRSYVRYFDPMQSSFDPCKLPCGSPRGYRGRDRVRSLVIIDECAEFFDQYSSAKDPRIQTFLSWLRHCSKRGQDVFLIVQSKDFINKNLRTLCARFVVCTNLSLIRIPVLHLRFLPNVSVAVTYDRYGNRGGLPLVFLRQCRWGRYYDTAEQISTHMGFSNAPVAKVRGSSVSQTRFRAFMLVALYLLALFFLGCRSTGAGGLPSCAGRTNTTNIHDGICGILYYKEGRFGMGAAGYHASKCNGAWILNFFNFVLALPGKM